MPDLFDLATRVHGAVEWGEIEAAEKTLREELAEAWDRGHRCAIGYVAVPSEVPEGGYVNPYKQAPSDAGGDS